MSTIMPGAAPTPAIVPLSRPTLHDQLIDRVRALIVEGQLAPGTRIHEGELGKALGVSRTPLREALKVIASEGLVELVPGRGLGWGSYTCPRLQCFERAVAGRAFNRILRSNLRIDPALARLYTGA